MVNLQSVYTYLKLSLDKIKNLKSEQLSTAFQYFSLSYCKNVKYYVAIDK